MSTSPELQAQTQRLASLIGMTRSLRVYQMDNLPAPIAWGIVRPAICFPSSFCTDYTEPQREVMILHELAHLQANDPLWLIVSDATLALLWWHPAAWWARHEFRAACELAADEASLRLEQGPELLAEGLVLLGKRLPVAGGIATFGMAGNGFRSALAQRVQRLLQLNGSQVRPIGWSVRFGASVIGASLIAAIAFTGTLLLAQPQSAQARTLPELWHGSMLALLGPEATTKPSPQRSKANGEPEIETVRLPVDFKKLHRGLEIELDRVLSEHQVLNEITKLVPRTPETRLRNFRYDPDNGKLIMQGTQDATDFIAEKVTSLVAPVPQVEIEVRLVEIKGQEALLMKLLGTNFSYAPVFESRPRWKPDLASDIEIAARTNKNIRLDFMPEISGQPLLLKRSQAQPLIAAFENQTGVEILTTPRVTTFSGHEAQIAVTDSKSIYTVVIPPPADAKPTPSPEGNVVSVPVTMTLSQTFELGPASYLRPTVLPNGRDIQLNVIMRHAEFLGYDARTNATTGANVNTSQPHFRIRQVRIDTKIPSGSTLVLGSAPIAETIIMKDKVVGLGDLPVVGELFRTTTTNTLKKQMLVLVTPRRVSGEVNSTATKKTDEP